MTYSNDSSGNLNADRRYEYAKALFAEKDFISALDLLKQTAELIPNWSPLWFLMGEIHDQLEARELAILAYQKALLLDPADRLGAGLKLAKITGNHNHQSMSPAYIAALFDQYADRFDDHLVKALHYQGPEILYEALRHHCETKNRHFHFNRAADLGCGTGLMAAKLLNNIDEFWGVDISEQMVKTAKQSNYYSEVHCADITSYLATKKIKSLDLLIAADVLVYVSDLEPIFQQAARVLTANGLFAFTVQSVAGGGYQLGSDMRYHHSADYIREASRLAALKVLSLVDCTTRMDAGKPVNGFAVILSTF